MSCVWLVDESVKYLTLPAVHLQRRVSNPTSITTTVGHEVDIDGQSDFTHALYPYII